MKKAIVYASTTGNTEAMANAIAEGAKEAGAEVILTTAENADSDAVLACDELILGSPAMGDEVLEDSMEDFFTKIEGSLSGKNVAIFGSYDWGDGQWLRDWSDRAKAAGANVSETLQINLTPDEAGIEQCKSWAKSNM